MSAEENKRIVLGFTESLSSGSAAAALGALADSATWWVACNFALCGTKTKAQFAELAGGLASKIDGELRPTPKGAEGDQVAVKAESYTKMKTGKTYQNQYHFLFVVRDGKIQQVKEYLDTIDANEVLAPERRAARECDPHRRRADRRFVR